MTTRLNILPGSAFLELRGELSERLDRLGAEIDAGRFGTLLDPLMREVFHGAVAEAGAHEGTIWIADEAGEFLLPAYNTGPRADEIVGKFKQPLNSGLICMVFASGQPFLENEVATSTGQSKLLDLKLHLKTTALIAVPFYFLHTCRGVISCVQLSGPEPAASQPMTGFRPQHLACIQRTANVLTQLIEYQLLGSAIGWQHQS